MILVMKNFELNRTTFCTKAICEREKTQPTYPNSCIPINSLN